MVMAIRDSVGYCGINNVDDVLVVETLLNGVCPSDGGPSPSPLALGTVGADLNNAIRRFQQRQNLPVCDGRVDPGKSTWRRLVERSQIPTLPDGPIGPLPGPPARKRLLSKINVAPEDWGVWDPRDFPLLTDPLRATMAWNLDFPGSFEKTPSVFTYECAPEVRTKHVAVAVQEGCDRPTAYLLYLHHSTDGDYKTDGDYFLRGIGDLLVGRLNVLQQLAQSERNIAVVIPEPRPGQSLGIFNTDERLLTAVLKEIDEDITGGVRDLPPLLLACYSDGIGQVDRFKKNCPNAAANVKAIYDLDGAFVTRFRHVTFRDWISNGTEVFRYVGVAGPAPGRNESKEFFLHRMFAQSPSIIPLPFERWRSHLWAKTPHPGGPGWWLHWIIPTCMLAHGLMATTGI